MFFPSDETHKPSDGYINLADFGSAKEAADHINKVANNKTLVRFSPISLSPIISLFSITLTIGSVF